MIADRGWARDRIAAPGDRTALVADGRTSTFRDLAASIDAWSETFDAAAVSQDIVVVTGDYSESTIGALLALFLRGAVAVPLHGGSRQQIADVTALTGADFVVDTGVGREVSPAPVGVDRHPLVQQLFASNEAGLILLSSGSTGTPKVMLLSLDRLFERHRLRPRSSPLVTAAFLLFDHIGGFNTLVHSLFTAGTLVKLESRDAVQLCRSIEQYGIELLPATPTFLNMLLITGAYAAADLRSLKMITYGTEVMLPSTLKALVAVLPGVTFKQTYGLSEVGILPTKSKANDSVWMKLATDGSMKVVDGILWVKSAAAMLGYLNAPSPFDADGWLCTGDQVDVDGDHIRVRGREQQIINVGGLKVFPAEVEDRLLRAPFVNDAVVWGKKNAVTGFIVAASIAKAPAVEAAEAKREILEYCRRHLDDFKVPRFIEFVDEPLHTARFKKAKVDRT